MKHIKHILLFLFVLMLAKASAQCPTVAISGTHVSCFAGSNGTVTSAVSGGTGPYSYVWNNGANTPSITGLVAGIYYVNVTDLTTGCTVFNLFVVNEPNQLMTSLTQQSIDCFGASTGSIDLTVSGGSLPYTYLWSTGATSQDVTGLSSASYTVTVTDFKNCTSTTTTIVTQTASAVNSTLTSTNVSCPLGADGSANLITFGGQGPYTYSWNSGLFISEDITGLNTGTYNVVITDALGCTATDGIFISEPTPIATSVTGTDVSCFGGSNGFVDLTASGGTPPYNFNWTSTTFTLGNTEDLPAVGADTYDVIITDANGCTSTTTFTVSQPTALSSSVTGTNVSCNGYTDGAIAHIVNGGAAPYSYSWSNSTAVLATTTQSLTNLPAESYSVVVTDFNGCTVSSSITITQPLLPLTATVSGSDAKCFGDNSGSADLTIAGGTLPYNINWSNGAITEDQLSLFAGSYFVTVIDNNGCLASSSIVISQPLAPLSSTSLSIPATCFGFSNGAINYEINGGTAPYSYTWINSLFSLSVVSQDLLNFPAETYIVTVTDANNCVLVDTTVISQPTLIQTSIVSIDINCFGDATGDIDLTIVGGTPLYNVLWSNAAVTEDINSLIAGTYVVTITDANGCIHTDSATLTQPASALSSSYFVHNTTCYGGADGYIFYDVQGGSPPYDYNWSNGDSLTNIFDLTAGVYVVTVTDANGCTLIDSITVEQPLQITVAVSMVPVTCFGQSNGNVDITVSGGTSPYQFQWMNSSFVLSTITEDLISFPADTYNVTVTDSVGCTTSIAIVLTQPAPLNATVTANNITCAGGTDGNINIDISGGVTPYTYLWSNGSTLEDQFGLPAGTYTVTISDANNCTMQQIYTLLEPLPISLTYQTQEVSCSDQRDGVIYVSPSGGTGAFTYSWSNGTTLNPATDLPGGPYTLTVTDISGCTKDTIIEMPVNPKECIEIPTAFTPNDDGKNDDWQIRNIYLYPNCTMKIFNRWGNLLLESNGYPENWNGRYNGNKLPSETYYYILDLGNETKPRAGAVTIVY